MYKTQMQKNNTKYKQKSQFVKNHLSPVYDNVI